MAPSSPPRGRCGLSGLWRPGRRGEYTLAMIRAAIVGLGRWGQNLVECTQGKTDKLRFTAGVARTPEKARSFAADATVRSVQSGRRRHG